MSEEIAVSAEVESKEEQDGFEAGFAAATGDSEPASENVAPETTQEASAGEARTEQAAPIEQPVLAGLTESQIKAMLAKTGDIDRIHAELEQRTQKIFGTLGNIQQTLVTLRNQPQTAATQQAAATQVRRLENLRAEYPELASLIEQDLSSALSSQSSAQSGPAFDPEVINGLVEQRTAVIERKYEERFIDRDHPGWRNDINTPDFRVWMQTQTPEYQAHLWNSGDSAVVSQGLAAFKTWRDQSKGSKARNTKRLEAAITPTGGNQVAEKSLDEEEAMLIGFKQAYRPVIR